MSKIRKDILRKLMHNPESSFSEIFDKSIESNKFSYHLKVLEEEEYIMKEDGKYSLTHKGKKEATFIDGSSGNKVKAPLLGVLIIVKKDDKFLLMRRTKEPFYGYWGVHGGKMNFDEYPLECAKKELKEETGLEGDLKLKGMFLSKTYNQDEENSLSFNHQQYIIVIDNIKGEIIEKNREGENKWFTLEETKELKLFIDVPILLEIAISEKDFTILQVDRYQKNDEFVNMKILKKEEF